MKTDSNNIIDKLMDGRLAPKERELLNSHKMIDTLLQQQWEEVENDSINGIKEERMLNGILKQIHKRKNNRSANRFFNYGVAAMFAICIGLSALLLYPHKEQEVIYVMNTGHQSIESVTLADGSTVMLNAGSRLTYPKEFTGEKREVELSGQAFFSIKADQAHPFIVKTKKMDVTALGTSFEVFSYDNDQEAETILLTGKVKVELAAMQTEGKATFILHPNEKLNYSPNGKVNIAKVDAAAYSSWREGKRMNFKNESLEMILPRLEKWFGQQIKCDADVARKYRFTFTIHNESLDLILNYLSHSAPLSYKLVSNDHYLIEEKN